jgi:hypothetical protein
MKSAFLLDRGNITSLLWRKYREGSMISGRRKIHTVAKTLFLPDQDMRTERFILYAHDVSVDGSSYH